MNWSNTSSLNCKIHVKDSGSEKANLSDLVSNRTFKSIEIPYVFLVLFIFVCCCCCCLFLCFFQIQDEANKLELGLNWTTNRAQHVSHYSTNWVLYSKQHMILGNDKRQKNLRQKTQFTYSLFTGKRHGRVRCLETSLVWTDSKVVLILNLVLAVKS